jgi:hypothetical protein
VHPYPLDSACFLRRIRIPERILGLEQATPDQKTILCLKDESLHSQTVQTCTAVHCTTTTAAILVRIPAAAAQLPSAPRSTVEERRQRVPRRVVRTVLLLQPWTIRNTGPRGPAARCCPCLTPRMSRHRRSSSASRPECCRCRRSSWSLLSVWWGLPVQGGRQEDPAAAHAVQDTRTQPLLTQICTGAGLSSSSIRWSRPNLRWRQS